MKLMKKKFILGFMAALMSLACYALDFSWMENAPEKYLPATTTVIVTRTSPCNQGDEAFMDFIPKFRKDKAFRNSRLKFAADDEMGPQMAQMFDNWSLVKAGKGVSDGCKYYATWYNVSADEVCFKYEDWPADPNADWGGSGIYARFRRIDGKWYLIGLQIAG